MTLLSGLLFRLLEPFVNFSDADSSDTSTEEDVKRPSMSTPSPLDGVGWTATGDYRPPEPKRQPIMPRFKQIVTIIPMFLRFCVKLVHDWWTGEPTFINIFAQFRHDPHCGVPIGGIGSGSMGRDFRGAFNKFSLVPGVKEIFVKNIKADQFILTVRSVTGTLLTQRLLSCAKFRSRPLSTWNKGFAPKDVRYRGLFPRSWTEYSLPDLGLTLICEQISPVIAHDYKDSCLPLTNFVWTIKNDSITDYNVSITFTFRNGTGNREWAKEGPCRTTSVIERTCTGIEMPHTIRGMRTTYGIYAKRDEATQSISMTTFDPVGDGKAVWKALEEDGNFENNEVHLDGRRELGVAVCVEAEANGETTSEIEFVLVWHMPEVQFGKDAPFWKRRYTRFFPDEKAAEKMAVYAFQQRTSWQRRIEEWQAPVVTNRSLPEWYRSALFNELYFVSDGSVSWLEYEGGDPSVSSCTEKHLREYGRFGYMESWEYMMINTYDVHFYASAALLENWPQIEVSVQLDFADTLGREDNRSVQALMEGEQYTVKRAGRIPHDVGHPLENPWNKLNAYRLHDTGEWKDLNLKFVMLSYRDYERVIKENDESGAVLSHLFDRSMEIIQTGKQEWDVDGDGMIENSGFADQTYDVWTMDGTSAYCGSLWLAALESARRMAVTLGRKHEAASLEKHLEKATASFVKKLWNGRYFKFDENNDAIMADQLCGVWFMAAHDGHLERTLVDNEKIKSALETIFENNVMKFCNGRLGAVNGMRADGKLDTSAIQSEEVWTGTSYALASFYALVDDREKAFHVAEGIYGSCWRHFGLQYQTPEAILEKRFYRAIGYMRPLAIWSIHNVLQRNGNV